MTILITGGLGYVGSNLVQKLLNLNFKVRVLDLKLYGDLLFDNDKNLELFIGDIRDQSIVNKSLENVDVVIHLACISNDPSFDLNPKLGRSINLDSFEPFVKIAKNNGVSRFIYASSSSVYGLKKENNVDENFSLNPLTDYSKYKAECEKILLKYTAENFVTTIVRPATVCGYSQRQRFDLVVNILTNFAYNTGQIKVFGGNQLRPNIHIDDMTDCYIKLLNEKKELIMGEVFNVGYENSKVIDLANKVKNIINLNTKINQTNTDDNRSYHISSEKIKRIINFSPKFSIDDAVKDISNAFKNNKYKDSMNNEMYFNIKRMKSINLK